MGVRIFTTGIESLDEKLFQPIKNAEYGLMNKPRGGLWGSTYTKDDIFPSDWVKWGIYEEFFKEDTIDCRGVVYSLKNDAKILDIPTIYQFDDRIVDTSTIDQFFESLSKYYTIEIEFKGRYDKKYVTCDWEAVAKDYDAIRVPMELIELSKYHSSVFTVNNIIYTDFSSWDCESWLIFNFNCIDTNNTKLIDFNDFVHIYYGY